MPILSSGLFPHLRNMRKAGVLSLYASPALNTRLHEIQNMRDHARTPQPVPGSSSQTTPATVLTTTPRPAPSAMQFAAPTARPVETHFTVHADSLSVPTDMARATDKKNSPTNAARGLPLDVDPKTTLNTSMTREQVNASVYRLQKPNFTHVARSQWPPVWQEWGQKLGSSLVIWTYFELGDDLLNPSLERRALMQRILGSLQHPKGTHAFWPMSAPQAAMPQSLASPHSNDTDIAIARIDHTNRATESQLIPCPDLFWSGVAQAKARFVIVLGENAFQFLGTGLPWMPHYPTQYQGKKLILEKDPADLLQDEKALEGVIALLRTALAPVLR